MTGIIIGAHEGWLWARQSRVPFAERGGKLRGVLDLVTGRYPAFLFGCPVGRMLPVFHLHDVEPSELDRQLQHLAENKYETVTADAIARFVRDGRDPGPGAVALCFDDARASLWTVAFPLLRRYGMRAIAFAIPGRVVDAHTCRPTLDGRTGAPEETGHASSPFVTWPELQALHESGVVDVQSHSYSHSSVFCGAEPTGFVTPAFRTRSMLSRPLVSNTDEPVHFSPEDLGAPLFPQRSRLSDAVRFLDDAEARQRCIDFVRERGGARFFQTASWRAELETLAARGLGQYESGPERLRALRDELDRARAVLDNRLGTTVRHLCFPWGIAGDQPERSQRHSATKSRSLSDSSVFAPSAWETTRID